MLQNSCLLTYIFIVSILLLSFSCENGNLLHQEEASNTLAAPADLTCEYMPNPSVVDVAQPRLSWVNHAISEARGLSQTAYQVRVASTKEKIATPDLWDSNKVSSDSSIRIAYKGKPLASRQACWWQVRVWDQDGNVSAWSETNFWRMGQLHADDWKATWIGAPWQGEEAFPRPKGGPWGIPEDFGPPAPMLRKAFKVDKPIAKAVAFVTGLGYFEFYANGKKIGNDVLVPNQTNYGKRPSLPTFNINVPDDFKRYKVMYLAYDITDNLQQGENAIGAIVGNGFYNPAKFWCEGYGTPRFMGQVHITFTDGSEAVIVSDESWKAAKSPILMNMVYYGENYDARKELTGWNEASFNDENWPHAVQKQAPEGDLVAHTAHTDKVIAQIQPVSVEKLGDGHFKVDFGIEISGWVRLNNVEGPAGQKVNISFNSNLYSGENNYTFKGNGPENYAPRFNWFVFSAVEIKNWPGVLQPEHITAEVVNTFIETSATFETSNPLFNTLNTIWRRSQEDNMHGGIASDCPHRERNGYTGDGQVVCATVMHNYDARNFYYKWVQDMNDAQIEKTGYVPNGAPWQPGCGGGVAWGAAICIMPWEFYQHYGAKDMLVNHYDAMKGYVRYMQQWVDEEGIMFSQRKGARGEVLRWFNLGEWEVYNDRSGDEIKEGLVHSFYLWKSAENTAKTAKVLGKEEEAKHYKALAERTKKAFHERFYDEQKGSYGIQGSNVFALRMGVPANVKDKVIKALVKNLETNGKKVHSGIFGTRYLFEILAENGLNSLAYHIMNGKDEPSFGRWLELGTTTTRESWTDGKGSFNHPMFGGGFVWFYRNLAGMQVNPALPGYKEIIFRPQPINELDFVTYKNKTVHGEAGISWRHDERSFIMDITVPIGSSAKVFIPANPKDKIREGDIEINSNEFIEVIETKEDYVQVGIQSGKYTFTVEKL